MDVVTRVIFGTAAAVEAALVKSAWSHRINTAFVERHNGTTPPGTGPAEGAEDVLLLEGLVGSIPRSRSSRCTVTTSAGR